MDNPATESGVLDTNQAASLFANMLEPQQEEPKSEPTDATEPVKAEGDKPTEEPQEQEEAPAEDGQKVTIEVDGKAVELTKAELAEAYKNGLRQADYTRKTMETAEQKKAASAEVERARAQRFQYAQGLQQAEVLLTAALQEQSKVDWEALLNSDPQEFLKQKHLAETRQAALQEARGRLAQVSAIEQQEREHAFRTELQSEHQALLDKLPEWKDAKKAQAEQKAIAEELLSRGFDHEAVFGKPLADGRPDPNAPGLTNHKLVLLARDAMLYREMIGKANAAAKKVSQLPQKVERPGGGENTSLDKRSANFQKLSKSGRIEDAAAIFSSLM